MNGATGRKHVRGTGERDVSGDRQRGPNPAIAIWFPGLYSRRTVFAGVIELV